MNVIDIVESQLSHEAVKEAVSVLTEGGIVVLPTETVYGLAVAAHSGQAKKMLYKIKGRSFDKKMALCLAKKDHVYERLALMPPYMYRIIESFLPGPLTVIFYERDSEEKIGVRVSSYPIVNELVRQLNMPVYLTSANISGEEPITSVEQAIAKFGDEVDLMLDAGYIENQGVSTVVDFTYHPFRVMREGVIPKNDLMSTFLRKKIVFVCTGNTCRSPMAEYLLKKVLALKYPMLYNRFEIISRGVMAMTAQPASKEVVNILQDKEGIDAGGHRSQILDQKTVLSADLIIVMEEKHKEYVAHLESSAENRIFLLSKFLLNNTVKDICDPIGKPPKVYEKVFDQIKEAVNEIVDWLF